MTDPSSSSAHSRMSTINPSSIYTFSHVFPPDTTQSDFFSKTTLPLVRDVLEGQNGLLFAYGVTNSGKTYTMQGGGAEGSAGIIPRTLDVIFNSIEGLHGDGKVGISIICRTHHADSVIEFMARSTDQSAYKALNLRPSQTNRRRSVCQINTGLLHLLMSLKTTFLRRLHRVPTPIQQS